MIFHTCVSEISEAEKSGPEKMVGSKKCSQRKMDAGAYYPGLFVQNGQEISEKGTWDYFRLRF